MTGQFFWTRGKGYALRRLETDDRLKKIDARAGRQRLAAGTVHRKEGHHGPASSVFRKQAFLGLCKPGASPKLSESVHAQ